MNSTTTTTRTLFRAEGFTCPSCVNKIEKQIGKLKGVSAVKVHFASARIEVDHDSALTTSDDVIAAVARAGYVARVAAF